MPYASLPGMVSSVGAGAGSSLSTVPYGQQDLLTMSQDLNRMAGATSYGSEHSYSTAPSPTAYASSATSYDGMGYQHQPMQQRNTYTLPQQQQAGSNDRRLSQPSLASQSRENFGDALDAGRGMVAMSQNATPRNIYGPRSGRGSTDSYGFPATHSSSSSISSTSTYPSYYGSVDSSVTDFSSTSESMEPITSRTLPRPSGLLTGNAPPAPQSMMGQFSSKVSSSTQKKHKCKICDKRFTRPSSLQTHMYSHTGEKPFSCDVDGCGRHFSVVSNLRRHRKVHKGGQDTADSADES